MGLVLPRLSVACGGGVVGEPVEAALECLAKGGCDDPAQLLLGTPLLTIQEASCLVTSFRPSAWLLWPDSEAPSDMFTHPFPLWG